jgi:hypothetical protein
VFDGDPRFGLVGRQRECEALDRLLADVRAHHSRVLVLRGEPGVGKSALLNRRTCRQPPHPGGSTHADPAHRRPNSST